jgi:DNA-binding NarL/FixJ family response regulator
MKSNNIRVVLASDSARARDVLRQVVEKETGAVVIGEAENSARALNLTKNLRPDIAIIDTSLPYVIGLDDVPLSRIGGLDTAQSIAERTPATRVVLLGNLNTDAIGEHALQGAGGVNLIRDKMDRSVPFTLQELSGQEWQDNGVVFANLELKRRSAATRSSNLIYAGMFLGGATLAVGWMLIVALWLIPAGVYIAATGAAVLLLSLAAKILRPAWRRFRSERPLAADTTNARG